MADTSFASANEDRPQRGRLPRAESASTEGRRARRRPDGVGTDEVSLKLAIPTWVKEKYPETEFVHRWFAARPGRIEWAKQNDWDPVEGGEIKAVPATDKDGNAAPHMLFVKYRDWYEADRGHREASRLELEQQMLRKGAQAKGDNGGETLSSDVSYADASNRLR